MNQRIVIVGAGNVATHLARTMKKKGIVPTQIWSRSLASASILANDIGSLPVTCFDEVIDDADMYIISVPDQALSEVVRQLCSKKRNGVFVHTSGTMSMDVFDGNTEHYGVLYPMQTFSKQKTIDFSVVPCFLEASDARTLSLIRNVACLLSDNLYELSGEDRRWLHVAAVFACNFSNACYAMAARILEHHGLQFNVMLPLLKETIGKLQYMSPSEAQTGPAIRGDKNVMDKHLTMLNEQIDLKNVYKILSDEIEKQSYKNIKKL